jgi:hypothetical protein
MSLWGLGLLGAAMMAGFVFTIGLRTGVTDSRFGDIKRSKSPILYWALQPLYLFMICLSLFFGLGLLGLAYFK